jgi:hypothetical protein
MKNSIILLTVLILLIVGACQTKHTKENNSKIVGIWQDKNVKNNSIEFTENNEYFIRKDNKRLEIKSSSDSISQIHFFYKFSEEKNLKIFSDPNDTTKCNIVFLDSNNIKFSILRADTILYEAEFYRIMK